ncbi:hypothetical protein Tco_0632723, partial [Tanacetum coccineum]
YGYCKNHKKTVKTGQTRTWERKECTRAGKFLAKDNKVNLGQPLVNPLEDKNLKSPKQPLLTLGFHSYVLDFLLPVDILRIIISDFSMAFPCFSFGNSTPYIFHSSIEIQTDSRIFNNSRPRWVEDTASVLNFVDNEVHLEYAFLEGNNKLPIIIAKDLSVEEKAALIKVLKSHKRAIAWKLSDIKGINPEFCTHKILMEEDYKLVVQHQRRVNPKIHDVIKKEGDKLLDAGLIYPISDSPWVSPIHCVPNKGGFTVVENDENELIPTRLVTGWRVCIDYQKLNEATRKDHFLLPFMDQMLERLEGNEYYCFLDGFSGYFQIPINPHD